MRHEILKTITEVKVENSLSDLTRVSKVFGENIFNLRKMEEYVSKKTLKKFKNWIIKGVKIDKQCADKVAEAMKDWALSKGTTHYTHWFQPMTGLTAEKHDSFIKLTNPGQVIEDFSGSQLICGEPDASSFPSGGIRATFEARGYTAWDPSSPAFIMETPTGKTLCIPSIFISYTGEALDKKLPLLRSDIVVDQAARDLLSVFNHSAKKVYSTCGAEQEYFLVDRKFYNLRQDLILCGRTLIGAGSPKHQQLDDQYFGSIKERVMEFMNRVEDEAYKYGIPLATRHNEVAPNQFEFAPIFEESNLAADHNQLLMDIMNKVSTRLGLVCLFAEKPFAGINGSGKHLNWSLCDNNGINLLDPGDTPEDNLRFLTFIVAVLRGVHKYSDLLYASIVSAGNEHRLGANEAPPAIISVFMGEYLDNILNQIEKGKLKKKTPKDIIDLKLDKLPVFAKDNTDRNRTSPFAFTGQKFEFRAVGSNQNISTAITFLNVIMADSLDYMNKEINKKLNKTKSNLSSVVLNVLKKVIKETKAIRFEGNNYSDEWVKEAEKRGLPNVPSAPEALKALTKKKNISLISKYKVLSKNEIISRYNIWLEMYITLLEIEGCTLMEIVNGNVLPAALEYQNLILENIKSMSETMELTGISDDIFEDLKDHAIEVSTEIFNLRKNIKSLNELMESLEKYDEPKKGQIIFDKLKPLCLEIRKYSDSLETIITDKLWTLPKYREMLFLI